VSTTTLPPLIGSAWDIGGGSEAPLAHHLAEWVEGSAIHPELAAANLQSLAGREVLEALVGELLEQRYSSSTHYVTTGQYGTGGMAAVLRPLEPLAESGGWWCSGLDPLADWAPMAWGCFRPDRPRWDQEKDAWRKYEHPAKLAARSFWLKVPASIALRVADRYGLELPPEVAADGRGDRGAFWRWWEQTPALPLLLTEGAKKAAALLSIGVPAVALAGIWNGCPKNRTTDRPELLADLAGVPLAGRPVWVLFDHSDKPKPAEPLAADCLGRLLAAAGAVVRVGIVPGTHGKGADDHLGAGGSWEALAAALLPLSPRAVLPRLRSADRVAAAGQWLGDACPIPSPEAAPLVVLQAPMGCGKTEAIAAALAPMAADGVPVLMPSHRKALGQAAAERVGVPWRPAPGSDERQQGAAGCWDSWCPGSGLRISGHGWSGGALVLDEWAQACEHLLLSTGTALGDDRRAVVLRTLAEQLPRMRQTIAADAQMPDWAVRLLERLSGRRALLIRSNHQPMAGRLLHAPAGFGQPQDAAAGFWIKWSETIAAAEPFLCWVSAQKAGMRNAAQTLAIQHKHWRPADLVDVIDSSTPELAAELAADPDGFAERRTAEARRLGVNWALYCSPAISSGVSFSRWRPACVLAYAGGRIAPEHVAQALARVRCPEVPVWLFAPERCPGGALQMGSGATDPARLIAELRATTDPLLGALQTPEDDGACLEAWAELAAHRNRQRLAYRATIAGLLQREGWELQAPEPERPDAETLARSIAEALGEITDLALWAEDSAVIAAPALTPEEAAALDRRRTVSPEERAALQRHRLALRWGLGAAAPSRQLLEAERDKLRDRLRLGWLLTTPEALPLVPEHDRLRIAALDVSGRPFEPDRLRVALAPRVAALQSLGVPLLLERFAAGETIAANDPAVLELHANANAHRGQLLTALGVSPRKLPSGTLRALLEAIGWKLEKAGRIKARGTGRDAYTYSARGEALPEGVKAEALAAAWLAELRQPLAARRGGAKNAHTGFLCMGEKSPSPAHAPPPRPVQPWPLAAVVPIPWAAGPPPPSRNRPNGFGRPPAELLTA
jgi:hypothetical protein